VIIYDPRWLEALGDAREAKRWRASGIISEPQCAAIAARFTTPLYAPTLFVRIALFFFAAIAVGGLYGMVVIAGGFSGRRLAIFTVLCGALALVALDAIVGRRHLYQSGIDEALLYTALCFTAGGLVWLYLDASVAGPVAIRWLIALPFLVWGALRFADRLAAAAAYFCALGVLLAPLMEGGGVARAALPFATMAIGLLSYVLARAGADQSAWRPYAGCLLVVEALGLATVYGAGNYFAVRKANQWLMGELIPDGGVMPPPLGFLFWAFTALTPVAYAVRGVLIRDRLLLRAGLVTAAFSVLTFVYYVPVAPAEVTLTAAGAALLLIAIAATRHLRTRRDGYTDKNLLAERLSLADAEALVTAHALGAPAPVSAQPEGGGTFGGGGASEKW